MSLMLLALKATLVPLLIGAITLAGRRWGPTVAGWLSGMPVVAGPIMFFMAVEQGAGFASRAIVGMLLGVLACLAANLAYAWAATRFSWRGSVLCSLSVYFLAVALLAMLTIELKLAAAFIFVALFIAPRLFPKVRVPDAASAPARGEIAVRMAAGALLVVLVTGFAATFGAQLSGLLASFPVISTVLAVFSQRQSGHEFAVRLLRGIALGWYAFLVFGFVLGMLLETQGIAVAFVAAIACTLVTQLLSRRLLGGDRPATQAPADSRTIYAAIDPDVDRERRSPPAATGIDKEKP